MRQTIDPHYTFLFLGSDKRKYSRYLYWEDLYAFSYGEDTILSAVRVVPNNDVHYALYLILKRKKTARSMAQVLLSGKPQTLFLEKPERSENVDTSGDKNTNLIEIITEVLPDSPSLLPPNLLTEAGERIDAVISTAMVDFGLQDGLTQFTGPFGFQETYFWWFHKSLKFNNLSCSG